MSLSLQQLLKPSNLFAALAVSGVLSVTIYRHTDWLNWLVVDRADEVPMDLLLRAPTITVYQKLDDASDPDWAPTGSVGWSWDYPWQGAPEGIRVNYDAYWERDGVLACGASSCEGWEPAIRPSPGGGARPPHVFLDGGEGEGTFQFVMDYEIWNGHPGHGTLLLRNQLRSEPLHVVASVSD